MTRDERRDMNFILSEGRLSIAVAVSSLGDDICVITTGGAAHAGAVAFAIPRESLRGAAGALSASTSVLTAVGHKDDIPAKRMAEKIAAGVGKRVVAVCGIHFDDIAQEEIDGVMRLIDGAIERVIAWRGREMTR
jgi:hypothetical protein